jgi:hypothetical protein
MFFGAQARYDIWLLSFSSLVDLIAPAVKAPLHRLTYHSVARQLAINVGLGVVL